jgi:hypothetical protein
MKGAVETNTDNNEQVKGLGLRSKGLGFRVQG